MDEIRAIEKSVSELKTIQNRLKKLLNEKEREQSVDILECELKVETLSKELELANKTIDNKNTIIDDLLVMLEKRDKKNARKIKDRFATNPKQEIIPFPKIGKDIKLPEGYVKFKENGKWGIRNKNGKIIVESIYDEIGSYKSRFIGFIDGKVQILKQSPQFFYNVPIWGKYIYTSKTRDVFEVAGVNCSILAPTPDRQYEVGKMYCLIIDKISKTLVDIKVFEATPENISRKVDV